MFLFGRPVECSKPHFKIRTTKKLCNFICYHLGWFISRPPIGIFRKFSFWRYNFQWGTSTRRLGSKIENRFFFCLTLKGRYSWILTLNTQTRYHSFFGMHIRIRIRNPNLDTQYHIIFIFGYTISYFIISFLRILGLFCSLDNAFWLRQNHKRQT